MRNAKYLLFILYLIISLNSYAQELKAFEADGLWGYKRNEEIFIKPRFQHALDFQYSKGVVVKGEKVGVINSKQEAIVPFEYDMIHLLNDSLVRVANKVGLYGDYEMGVISESGKEVLPISFGDVSLRAEKLIVEKRLDTIVSGGEFAGFTSRISHYGIYSLDGAPILEPVYNRIDWINDSLLKITKDRYYALAKPNGLFLTDLKYTAFSDFYKNRSKVRVDSSYGFIDKTGNEVITPKYKLVSVFYRDVAVYCKHNWRLGFINVHGDEIFENNYEILKYLHLGCAAARRNGKWGMISTTGKVLLPFKYNDYTREFEGVIAFKRGNRWALFSPKGKRLTGFEFDSIQVFGSKESSTMGYWKLQENKYNQPVAVVTKGGQTAVINTDGELVIPFGLSPQELTKELEKLKIR